MGIIRCSSREASMSQASAVAPTAPISSLVSDIDQLAADVMADWKVPGVALAVVQDGEVALTRAYGQRDVEADLPVTPATQFVICSITKSFTATAIALLHNEGRLDWAKPGLTDIALGAALRRKNVGN
jgi:CubicO group peptidase (beta-lactamase class C family)